MRWARTAFAAFLPLSPYSVSDFCCHLLPAFRRYCQRQGPEYLKAGLAWWFKRYAPNDPTLEGLEFQAREARRGLWVDRAPMPPREFKENSEPSSRCGP